jgi:hypothetical protein
VAGDARNVAWSFSALRYSNREADGDGGALNEGWKRIRGGLLVQMFKRLLPIGGAPDESA